GRAMELGCRNDPRCPLGERIRGSSCALPGPGILRQCAGMSGSGSVDVARERLACDLDQRREGSRVVHGQVGQDLAVHLDAGELEALDKPVVGHVVGPGGRVDAGDPQLPEVALALATVAVAVGHRVEHLLLGLAVQARALPAVALGGLKYDPTLLLCVDGSLHACHWSILTCRGGHLSVTGSSGMERAQSPRSRLTRGTSA